MQKNKGVSNGKQMNNSEGEMRQTTWLVVIAICISVNGCGERRIMTKQYDALDKIAFYMEKADEGR